MKLNKLVLLLNFTIATLTFAQFNPGAKQISLSNADIASSNDVFSLFNNPAGLSQMNWREVGFYYSPAPFGFKELANGFIAYHEPTFFGSLAIGGMTYGFELYRETKLLLGYSYNFHNDFFAGLAINFHNVSIQNYGSDAAFYLNIGGLAYLTNSVRWGFSIHNLNRASVGNEDDQIPMVFNSGFSFDLIDEFVLNLAIEKDIRYRPSVMAGIDYDIIEYLSLRLGFSNEPSKFSGGVGINYSIISLDYSVFTHYDLGLTHQAGLIISFGREETRFHSVKKYLGIE